MTGASVTITGRLTADPVLRLTNGKSYSVANFTVAHTPRRLNTETQEWEDGGETLFLRVTAWTALAENAASSLHKGDMVVIIGRLGTRSYETESGEKRSEVICDAETIAVDLRWQFASVTRINAAAAAQPALKAV